MRFTYDVKAMRPEPAGTGSGRGSRDDVALFVTRPSPRAEPSRVRRLPTAARSSEVST